MKKCDVIWANAQQKLEYIMRAYLVPGSREPERIARVLHEIEAIRGTELSREELICDFARWKVGLQMAAELIPDLIAIGVIGAEAYDALRAQRSEAGKRGAISLHETMGTKQRKEKLRALWATGNYKSRDECAKREHERLGISYSTARRALRNTPEPRHLRLVA